MNEVGQDIIRRCKAGDKSAFRTLVQCYQRWLFGLGLKLLCDEEEAKDVVQETLIRVWQHLHDYDERRSFTAWIGTICTRLCMDRLRQLSHHDDSMVDVALLDRLVDEEAPDTRLENQELAAVIETLVQGLSPKQRTTFVLSQIEGYDSATVSEMTGMSAEQIKSNLYVARQTIRKRLKRLGYG